MPGPDPYAADLALLTEAAKGAGEIATRHFKRAPKVWDKGDGQGPVSEADLEVNDFLHATLLAARPDYGWMSEESDPLSDLSRLSSRSTFVIDPIDGTRTFIAGQPGFAHALAVVHDGVPMASVVFLPALGLTYTARRGGGATLNGAPISASQHIGPQSATILAARAALDPSNWPGGLPDLERHFRPSLAWRLALIGEGRFDAMLTVRDAWDWDIASAALIATEAGAQVTDRFGAPLRFNSSLARNKGVVAANPRLHTTLLAGLTDRSATTQPPDKDSHAP